MPVHDWSRADEGVFHHFHNAWIQELCAALNGGVLPSAFYAISEQVMGDVIPDVLTLQAENATLPPLDHLPGVATLEAAPPKVQFTAELEHEVYLQRQKRVAVRTQAGRRLVAVIEILSPGNKSSQAALDAFLVKAASLLRQGVHALLIDLLPPTLRDPQGIHGALWEYLGGEPYAAPPDRPLTLVAYQAGQPIRAFVEPLAVQHALRAMPLILDREHYVEAPLEESYCRAFERIPTVLRADLEATT